MEVTFTVPEVMDITVQRAASLGPSGGHKTREGLFQCATIILECWLEYHWTNLDNMHGSTPSVLHVII